MILDIKAPIFRNNPYPTYKYLRGEKKICRTQPFNDLLVTNYTDVKKILKRFDLFSSAEIVKTPATLDGPNFLLETRGMVGYDRPHHTKIRRFFNQFFTLAAIQKLEPHVRIICQHLIRNIIKSPANMVNVIDAFATPLPVLVLSKILGIAEISNTVKEWVRMLLNCRAMGNTPEVLNIGNQMFNYFNRAIEQKKVAPETDLISQFILAAENDPYVSRQEILAMLRLLLFAGTEPVTNLIGNGLLMLCNRPELQEQLLVQPSLINNFIEEILRFNSPILTLTRRVNVDCDLGISPLKAGEIVLALLGSANHDETIFPCAEKFDIHRYSISHLSFGSGIHYCLGAHLARLQTRIAFEELFKVFNKFEIPVKKNPAYLDAFYFRGIKNLWLITGKHVSTKHW